MLKKGRNSNGSTEFLLFIVYIILEDIPCSENQRAHPRNVHVMMSAGNYEEESGHKEAVPRKVLG